MKLPIWLKSKKFIIPSLIVVLLAGVVIAHLADRGDQIAPGQNLLELGDISGVEIELAIDESSGDLIEVGQEVSIGPLGLIGRISEIGPTASLATGKINFKVVAESGELIPGDVADVVVSLTYKLPDIIVVPLANVTVAQNETFVLVVEDGLVTKRVVELDKVFDSQVEIVSGLAEGDQVIVSQGEFLTLDEQVEVRQK